MTHCRFYFCFILFSDSESPPLMRTFSSETRDRLIKLLQEEFPEGLTSEELTGAYKVMFPLFDCFIFYSGCFCNFLCPVYV